MDEAQKAQIKRMDDAISKIYHSKDGGRTTYKLWLDAKAVDPEITLDWVRGWLRNNVNPKGQVGGAKNSYVAPRAYHEYQVDLFYITARQFQNQDYGVGMSIIDVFSKFSVVVPLKTRYAWEIIPALFKAFKVIGKHPQILVSDKEGALQGDEANAAYEEAGIQHIITGSAHL